MRIARVINIAATLRRPTVVTASVVVVLAGFIPTEAAPRTPAIQRVISTPSPIKTFKPVKLFIPKIDVDAPVVPVWTYQDGTMEEPKTAGDVGWWAGRKAGKGNLLLDGHHDWNGRAGSFYRLSELKSGDEIFVRGDAPDKVLTYRVIWVKNFDRLIDATDLLGNKNGHVATLITCGGTFDTIARTHRERVVARAELVHTSV
jgi:LPXTG-site transpeptidase (sortase) family protein